MPRVVISYHELIQDDQQLGDDQWMISRVLVGIEVDGKSAGEFEVHLKQTVGDDYETGAIEVGPPIGYKGPMNHNAFAEETEAYYRSLVGSSGKGMRISGGGQVRMINGRHVLDHTATFDADPAAAGW